MLRARGRLQGTRSTEYKPKTDLGSLKQIYMGFINQLKSTTL